MAECGSEADINFPSLHFGYYDFCEFAKKPFDKKRCLLLLHARYVQGKLIPAESHYNIILTACLL